MILFRPLLLLLAIFPASGLYAQKEHKAIKETINRFFEGMESGDTALLKSACTPAPIFQTYRKDRDGNWAVVTEDFQDFLAFVAKPTQDKYDEQIKFGAIHAEASLASVWTPYTFFINGKISHAGTNSFQLVKTPEGWKIQYIIDTRRRP